MSRGVDGDHLYSAPPPPPAGGVSRRPTSLGVGAARATCSIDGCDRPHEARGWCKLHYTRWVRNGDPSVVLNGDGPLTCQCVFPNVGPNDECVRCHRVIAEHVHQRRAAR